ncbi:MFS general substrate transporter [Aureobasidium subglaciale]|nr:MFS general substrate transporter [Aureobasidium subglaciale]KAI5222530.1 MFS general substrate transporter [Aureobasidium subglaciale]KAI5233130.1 MFS general substrate transporter [Aureobasidium subglaciale]KAI5251829.1 MFS general substrate transporter [Aureobasidium subglaciale]KAI5262228.1 MFS general substrate transporter [Aureobasidium subglaciale]
MNAESDIELVSSSSPMDRGLPRHLNDEEFARLSRRVVLKLDLLLLPFLCLLFLLNSLDKSNVGNAESGHFTEDLGLPKSALNVSVAWFFAVFVSCQPIGAYFGRKYGMARWVPATMSLWGVCTALHIAVQSQAQLVTLRILIAILESGFYPTVVSSFFYGQAALAGCFGGLLSWAVFSYFPHEDPTPHMTRAKWRSWEVLFLVEGTLTIMVAFIGFFWLPHSANAAWFLTADERFVAEERIRSDQIAAAAPRTGPKQRSEMPERRSSDHVESRPSMSLEHEEADYLLPGAEVTHPSERRPSHSSTLSVTADSGVSREDIFSAVADWKVWYLLICNILSAIPATAFAIFLPLVIKGIAGRDDLGPAAINLLVVPPFLAGAIVLWVFTWWSDRKRDRMVPILYGLAILLAGLAATVALPTSAYKLRYLALMVLLSGSFCASPLTVTWLSNNVPEPGKRAIVLGINGWGNFAGVISSMLFAPRFADDGYIIPFYITLACVLAAFVGYLTFRALIVAENHRRTRIVANWDDEEIRREAMFGDGAVVEEKPFWAFTRKACRLDSLRDWAEIDRSRRGDEKLTFLYSL